MKYYNFKINGQNCFNQPVKNDLKTHDNVRKITISQGDDCTTGCLRNNFRIFTRKCEYIVSLYCFNILSIQNDSI